jgi:hypothetical protein
MPGSEAAWTLFPPVRANLGIARAGVGDSDTGIRTPEALYLRERILAHRNRFSVGACTAAAGRTRARRPAA